MRNSIMLISSAALLRTRAAEVTAQVLKKKMVAAAVSTDASLKGLGRSGPPTKSRERLAPVHMFPSRFLLSLRRPRCRRARAARG